MISVGKERNILRGYLRSFLCISRKAIFFQSEIKTRTSEESNFAEEALIFVILSGLVYQIHPDHASNFQIKGREQ